VKAAVVTSIYGDYDTLKPVLPQQGADVEWVLVTDRQPDDPLGWRVIVHQRGMHPNRAAKYAKLFPWDFTDAPASVWIDASFRVVSPRFVTEALNYADPIAQFAHPWRDCIYDEADASIGIPKYAGEPMRPQVHSYRKDGHPEHWGLWATGVIARKHTDPVRWMSDTWGDLIKEKSFQDQISEPVALRSVGLRPSPLPGTHFSNPWLAYEGSEKH
jgi:hypothetical protein